MIVEISYETASQGRFYTRVVPSFNDDGTHEPLGPRDFPWGLENSR